MAELVDILAAGVVDSNGDPLDSGVCYFYEIGTTTKVTLYSDPDGTLTTSNPVTLDAIGKAEIYVNDTCRVVIFDSSGAQVADLDSVGTAGTNFFQGDLTIGSDAGDILTLNSSILGDLIPITDDTYDVGSDDLRWADGQFVDLSVHENLVVGVGQINTNLTVDATTGDPALKLRANGTDSTAWRIFLDNSASDVLIAAYNGVDYLFVDSAGELTLKLNHATNQSTLRATNVGAGDAGLALRVNDTAANEWNIFLDNSDSDQLKMSYNSVEAFAFVSGAVPGKFNASDISAVTTPSINTMYPNMICKARALTNASGTLTGGVNLSVARPSTGVFNYTFLRAMADATYSVTVGIGGAGIGSVGSKTTAGFTIATFNLSGVATNFENAVTVFGAQ